MATLPDPPLGRMIDQHCSRVPDPVDRLRFAVSCSRAAEEVRTFGPPFFRRWFRRLLVLDTLSRASRASKPKLRWREKLELWLFRRRELLFRPAKLAAGLACVVLLLAAELARSPEPPLTPPATVREAAADAAAILKPEPVPEPVIGTEPAVEKAALQIWLVETSGRQELYSNGLTISNEFLAHTGPRSFPVFARGPGTENETLEWRERPVGIVYHTTASDAIAPLERTNNQLIRYQGKQLLHYLRKEQLYNFAIDRFGRVYRVVPETEYAHHAGYSMWGEGGELYVNLNQSFIGVAFEARAGAAAPSLPPEERVTPAQLSSARLLTEMLRQKFGIVAENCITHEMVSLNPNQMLIGHHTDWSGQFPFASLDLPDNYQNLLPSVSDWGFSYDAQFVREVGGRVWPGVRRSQEEFRREAALRRMTAESYRRLRKQQFRELLALLQEMPPARTWADQVP